MQTNSESKPKRQQRFNKYRVKYEDATEFSTRRLVVVNVVALTLTTNTTTNEFKISKKFGDMNPPVKDTVSNTPVLLFPSGDNQFLRL
jgi:hypothetical protein